MKKIFMFTIPLILFGLLLFYCLKPKEEFTPRQLKYGTYDYAELKVESWSDCSIRIGDSGNNICFYFNVIDKKTLFETAKKLRFFFDSYKINSFIEFYMFLETNNIKYDMDFSSKLKNFVNCYSIQSFFEDFLVNTYGLKSGYSNGDGITKTEWDSNYKDYIKTHTVLNDRTIEEIKYFHTLYEKQIITYTYGRVEETITTGKKLKKGYAIIKNEEGLNNNTLSVYYLNGEVKKWTNYNSELDAYNNLEYYKPEEACTYFYSDLRKVFNSKNEYISKYYKWEKKYKNASFICVADDWLSHADVFNYYKIEKLDPNDLCSIEFKDYDDVTKDFKTKTCLFKNRVVKFWDPDEMGYWNVDIYDKNNNLIAYAHIVSPWNSENETRNIEVFSDGIIYEYKGAKVPNEDNLIEFESCKYRNKDGKLIILNGGCLPYNEFYKKSYELQRQYIP